MRLELCSCVLPMSAIAKFVVYQHIYSQKNPNIPVLGLSSYEHSVISVLSASVLISTAFPPVYTWHATLFYVFKSWNKFKIRQSTITDKRYAWTECLLHVYVTNYLVIHFSRKCSSRLYVPCQLHSVPQTTWSVICYHNIS